jgi:hypothetical protein
VYLHNLKKVKNERKNATREDGTKDVRTQTHFVEGDEDIAIEVKGMKTLLCGQY